MAKIKFGMMMTDARGKLGGHVFSKNRAGSFVRTKVSPSNPNTQAQSQARALFSAISQQWSSLTQPVRDSFDAAVKDWARTDIFGDLRNPTGKNLFQRLNNQAQSAGLAPVVTLPAKLEMPDAIISQVDVSISGTSIDLVGADISATTQLVVFATGPLSAGTKSAKNRLRQIFAVAGNAFDDTDLWDAYVAKFGAPALGQNIQIGVKYVLHSGQASPMQVLKAVISA